MKLITWNIQWCRGIDGRVDPARIVEHAGPSPTSTSCACRRSPTLYSPRCWEAVARINLRSSRAFSPAMRPAGRCGGCARRKRRRRHFGNMILSRLSCRAGVSPYASVSFRSRSQRHAADGTRGCVAFTRGSVTRYHHDPQMISVKRAAQVEAYLARPLRRR